MRNSFNQSSILNRFFVLGGRIKHKIRERTHASSDFNFSIDSPNNVRIDSKHVLFEGWLFPKSDKPYELRVRNNDNFHKVTLGIERIDVQKAFPVSTRAKNSGFRAEFEFEDGTLSLEVRCGGAYKTLYETSIVFSAGNLTEDIFNKNLSDNYPEHLNLLANRQQYYYEDESEASYSRNDDDPRLMALYLPQFHPFPENDKAWGKGFTEWSNVTTALPRFIGHQQPILPKDLGFYDLRLDEKIFEQIQLAKKYGFYGFTFYYYWFSGKKIMDTPLKSFLSHTEWDFNFSICWANENWTKRWDGRDSEVIIAQKYREEDPLEFIKDIEHILTDSRYVTVDNKPVLMVYRASELKNPAKYVDEWRSYFRKKHGRELYLVTCLSFDDKDPREYGFDAGLDFAPQSSFFKTTKFTNHKYPYLDVRQQLLDINFDGMVADYRSIALNKELDSYFQYPTIPCVTPSWDNDARKKGKGFIFQNSNPDIYSDWLDRTISLQLKQQKKPLIYVNAWNEWAEGAVMEPSLHMGHAALRRTAEKLAKYSYNKKNAAAFSEYGIQNAEKKKLAVVIHLYYEELWGEVTKNLKFITEPYDVFVTLNEHNKDFVPKLEESNINIYTFVLPNRGRDVLPFLFVARRISAAKYEYLLKLHTKKSKHRSDGMQWLESVIDGLMPSRERVEEIIALLNEPETGIIGPKHHRVSLKRHMGSNESTLLHLLERIYDHKTAQSVMGESEMYSYIGGTMMWMRVDVLSKILDLHLMPDDFQSEKGQIDGTTAHAVERLFGVISFIEQKKLYISDKSGVELVRKEYNVDKYDFAP